MNDISPRLKRVMLYQLIAVILNAFLVAGLSLMIIDWAAPSLLAEGGFANHAIRWIALLLMTYVGAKWLNNISLVVINMVVYGGDLEAAAEEAQAAMAGPGLLPDDFAAVERPKNAELLNFLIVGKPETPYARYQDADIFEWLDVEDDTGTVHRLQFEGTVDLKRGIPTGLEPGTILLPPGILYKSAAVQ